MQQLLLTASDLATQGSAPRRLRPENYESIWLTIGNDVRRLLMPKPAAAILTRLLEVAAGRRYLAFSGKDLEDETGYSGHTTITKALTYLAEVDLLVPLQLNTQLRRIRLTAERDSFEAKKLYPSALALFEALHDLGRGQKTFIVSSQDIQTRSGLKRVHAAKNMTLLVQRGLVTELMRTPGKVGTYRLDVKRRGGRGLQIEQLAPETRELDPTILFHAPPEKDR